MFLTDTSEDIDAHFRYIASRKTSMFFSKWTPLGPDLLKRSVPSLWCSLVRSPLDANFQLVGRAMLLWRQYGRIEEALYLIEWYAAC